MSRPRRQQLPPVPKRWRLPAGLRETVVLLLLASAAFLLLALLSFDAQDPSWASTGGHAGIRNAGGRIGANWAGLLYYFFGYPALLIPALLLWFGWRVYRSGDQGVPVRARGVAVRLLGLLLAMTCGAALAQIYLPHGALPNGPGGGLGLELGRLAAGSLNTAGATLFLVAAGLSGITWVTGVLVAEADRAAGHRGGQGRHRGSAAACACTPTAWPASGRARTGANRWTATRPRTSTASRRASSRCCGRSRSSTGWRPSARWSCSSRHRTSPPRCRR